MNELNNSVKNNKIEVTSLVTTTTPCCMAPLTNRCVGTLTVEESEVYKSLKERCTPSRNYIWQGLPEDFVIQEIIVRFSIPIFLNLSCTNTSHYLFALETLKNRSLVQIQFCPKLTILNPFNFTIPVNFFKMLQWYHKLDPTVECEQDGSVKIDTTSERKDDSITLQIYPKLTLKQWIEVGKINDVEVRVWGEILALLGEVVEDGEIEWEMISNAPVKETRVKLGKTQNNLLEKVGYHKKPSVYAYLHLIIFTQKVFEKYLFTEFPESTFGCTSTKFDEDFSLIVGAFFETAVNVELKNENIAYRKAGAAGVRKLQAIDPQYKI